MIRGVRGATTVEVNTSESILAGTHELLVALIEANRIQSDEIASIIFTTTLDLNAEYPAVAARALGWQEVALLCTHEMNVPQGLPHCIRILIHWNTDRLADQVRHVYLRRAVSLRPDRSQVNAPITGRAE